MCEPSCLVAWVTRLVRAERPRLVAIARREGLSRADALDAVQEAVLIFLGRTEPSALVDRGPEAARLLAVITRNAARNARRRHHRARPHDAEVEVADAGADAAAALAQAEARIAVSACVAQLGAGQQRVVIMRLLDEISGDDVAAALGTTPGNVAVMLHRARARLQACLRDADVAP